MERLEECTLRIRSVVDFFSLTLILRTFFAPFRQISANDKGRGLSEALRVFVDKMISRIIGAIMRTFLGVFGILSLLLTSLACLIFMIVWLLLPLLPILGLTGYFSGFSISEHI